MSQLPQNGWPYSPHRKGGANSVAPHEMTEAQLVAAVAQGTGATTWLGSNKGQAVRVYSSTGVTYPVGVYWINETPAVVPGTISADTPNAVLAMNAAGTAVTDSYQFLMDLTGQSITVFDNSVAPGKPIMSISLTSTVRDTGWLDQNLKPVFDISSLASSRGGSAFDDGATPRRIFDWNGLSAAVAGNRTMNYYDSTGVLRARFDMRLNLFQLFDAGGVQAVASWAMVSGERSIRHTTDVAAPGTATANTPSATVAIAAGAALCTVGCTIVTASSIVRVSKQSNDATAIPASLVGDNIAGVSYKVRSPNTTGITNVSTEVTEPL